VRLFGYLKRNDNLLLPLHLHGVELKINHW